MQDNSPQLKLSQRKLAQHSQDNSESESEYFTDDSSIDIHSPGPTRIQSSHLEYNSPQTDISDVSPVKYSDLILILQNIVKAFFSIQAPVGSIPSRTREAVSDILLGRPWGCLRLLFWKASSCSMSFFFFQIMDL